MSRSAVLDQERKRHEAAVLVQKLFRGYNVPARTHQPLITPLSPSFFSPLSFSSCQHRPWWVVGQVRLTVQARQRRQAAIREEREAKKNGLFAGKPQLMASQKARASQMASARGGGSSTARSISAIVGGLLGPSSPSRYAATGGNWGTIPTGPGGASSSGARGRGAGAGMSRTAPLPGARGVVARGGAKGAKTAKTDITIRTKMSAIQKVLSKG